MTDLSLGIQIIIDIVIYTGALAFTLCGFLMIILDTFGNQKAETELKNKDSEINYINRCNKPVKCNVVFKADSIPVYKLHTENNIIYIYGVSKEDIVKVNTDELVDAFINPDNESEYYIPSALVPNRTGFVKEKYKVSKKGILYYIIFALIYIVVARRFLSALAVGLDIFRIFG